MWGKVNNDLLMSWFWLCFVSSRKQISAAARIIEPVQFVSEVTGLKMPAEIGRGDEGGGERKESKSESSQEMSMRM